MLYVILVNICRVNQLIFTVQCELSKLQINPVKIFHFSIKTTKTDRLERFTASFLSVNRYKFKLVWIIQTGWFLSVFPPKTVL
jgi:hypothetical protein